MVADFLSRSKNLPQPSLTFLGWLRGPWNYASDLYRIPGRPACLQRYRLNLDNEQPRDEQVICELPVFTE